MMRQYGHVCCAYRELNERWDGLCSFLDQGLLGIFVSVKQRWIHVNG